LFNAEKPHNPAESGAAPGLARTWLKKEKNRLKA